MDTLGKLPVVKRCRLIEGFAFVFKKRQIVQRIIDKIGRAIVASVAGDDRAATDNLNPVDITLGQNLMMAVTRGH